MELEKQVGEVWSMESLKLSGEEEPYIICSRDVTSSNLCFRKITPVTVGNDLKRARLGAEPSGYYNS